MPTNLTDQRNATETDELAKPLTGGARSALLVSCAVFAALYYVFAAVAIVVIAVAVALDMVVMVGALRFGLAGRMVSPVQALCTLLTSIVRSLKLERGPECHVAVPRGVAPKLYDLTASLAQKIDVAPPSEIVFEMTNNASVLLHGYRTGRGASRLTVGFDLLAILSVPELEALLAHELAHAKLVQRGFRGVILNGVSRCWQTGREIAGIAASARQDRHRFYLAEVLAAAARPLTRLACRSAAAYSRQEEFAADRLAAEVCGPSACKSAMLATIAAIEKGSDLNLSERLMHLERDESFTDWLCSRLLPADDDERRKLEAKGLESDGRGEYDTHPTAADRIAVWGGDETSTPRDGASAIGLIQDPDFIAKKLIAEIERVISDAERADTGKILRWLRRRRLSHTKYTAGQTLLIIVCIFTFAAFIASVLMDRPDWSVITGGLLIAFVFLYRRTGFRERHPLPFPTYTALRNGLDKRRKPEDADDPDLQETLVRNAGNLRKRGRRAAAHWADCAYVALATGDYKAAAIASRLGLKADPSCPEALLANGVAEAYFENSDASSRSVDSVYGRFNMTGTITWGLGWAFALLEKWDVAEVYLVDAASRFPDEPTVLALLARSQWEQGRMNEALRNIRRAVELRPKDNLQRLWLARILLSTRRAKAALEQVAILEKAQPGDEDTMVCACSAAMLLGRTEDAERRIEKLLAEHPGPKTLSSVGALCMDAGESDRAKHYLEAARAHGFCPSTLINLASIEYRNENKEGARDLLLQALNVCEEPLPDATPVIELLPTILTGLVSCEEEVPACSGWVADIDLADSPWSVKRMTFLVFAPGLDAAKDYLSRIYSAMHPGRELDPGKVEWKPADKDDQPDGPASPGVYGFRPGPG